ncbi:MAG: 4-(cytidine 5'-diphospho)-2-C-methyl-D-erythritol kinase [Syntrophobacteraceae bacterium]
MIVETSVPAKINLWLEVIRKREDGYHELSSLMLPVSVFDRIVIEVGAEDGPISLECDEPEIPRDERNIAWRAAELFRKASGTDASVRIVLEKHIPSGAGLGGGSADGAGVLLALNSCFGHVLADAVLADLALSLGADVPFFLRQKAALAGGIGEKLEFVSGVPEYPLLLIKPPVSVPTAWVYQNLKLTRGRPNITLNRFNTAPWRLGDLVANDLESVTVPRCPVISEIKEWLLGRGALVASMSGSGPTVFGVFSSLDAARAAEAEAAGAWTNFWVRAARVIGAADIHIGRVNGP